ncbi:hypothetical protein ACJX0J_040867, partial [Zea mays]
MDIFGSRGSAVEILINAANLLLVARGWNHTDTLEYMYISIDRKYIKLLLVEDIQDAHGAIFVQEVIEEVSRNFLKPEALMDICLINHFCQNFVYSENQKSAFTEILDVLRAICHAHMLPLALTWVPTSNGIANGFCVGKNIGIDPQPGKAALRIHESACYVNDAKMQGFLHACADRHLEKGQGIAGRALKSNLPFFSPDIREYSIEDYPLAHHARKFGLHAAVAIRLRSTYTSYDDYILEFFLPVNCKGCGEQQMLLNNLSSTMQRICKSLRTVSEAEIENVSATAAMFEKTSGTCLPTGNSESSSHDDQPITESALQDLSLGDKQGDREPDKPQRSSMRVADKKRSASEKNFSLDVLRKYFSGSLRDAAMSLG